jgi:hypothetical protein
VDEAVVVVSVDSMEQVQQMEESVKAPHVAILSSVTPDDLRMVRYLTCFERSSQAEVEENVGHVGGLCDSPSPPNLLWFMLAELVHVGWVGWSRLGERY